MTSLSTPEPILAILTHPHGLLEGPRLGSDGEAVYSDVIAGGLWACSSDGVLRELLPKRRGIGGVLAHARGGWVLSGRSLIHLLPDGEQRELHSGDGVCGFNDLGTNLAGDVLAGALRYRPLAGEAPREGQLLRVGRDGEVSVLNEQVVWPNGIGISPDGETIYLSDYASGTVLAIAVNGGEARDFCRVPRGSTDGLAVDCEGGVWVALGEAGEIARFGPDGGLDEVFPMPTSFVSSLSFGGPDMCDVLISTADNRVDPQLGGTLLRARSDVPGLVVTPVGV